MSTSNNFKKALVVMGGQGDRSSSSHYNTASA